MAMLNSMEKMKVIYTFHYTLKTGRIKGVTIFSIYSENNVKSTDEGNKKQ